MNEPNAAPSPSVYQLRIVLRGISPLAWRRLLAPAEATLADLHEVLQTTFGWSGEGSHRFLVHGREYAADPRSWSSQDAHAVVLRDLGLREGERFVYEYWFEPHFAIEIGFGISQHPRVPATRGGRS